MSVLTVLHICISVLLVAVVLLQQGKGADVGATFGGGGQSFFGAAGADKLLVRFTTIVAACFMVTSILLALRTTEKLGAEGALFKDTVVPAEAPAAVEETDPVSATVPAAAAPSAVPAEATPAPQQQ